MKNWIFCVVTTALSLWLVVIGSNYPCLRGAGLALADFEAFVLLLFFAIPCLGWAMYRLVVYSMVDWSYKNNELVINRFAMLTVFAVVIYMIFAVPTIFSINPHPLRFVCVL